MTEGLRRIGRIFVFLVEVTLGLTAGALIGIPLGIIVGVCIWLALFFVILREMVRHLLRRPKPAESAGVNRAGPAETEAGRTTPWRN